MLLNEPNLKLFSFGHADAYARLLPYIVKLTLPPGVINLARNIPEKEVALIATKEMLAARNNLHPALIGLLIDAAKEIHGGQALLRKSGEFPGTARVDLPVSNQADEHSRFGSPFLYKYLPFWVATLVERAPVIVLPLAAVVFPVIHFLPQFLRWRWRSRIYRWYGELALLERDVATHQSETCLLKSGWAIWIGLSAPSLGSTLPRDLRVKPTRCASTSISFVTQ